LYPALSFDCEARVNGNLIDSPSIQHCETNVESNPAARFADAHESF